MRDKLCVFCSKDNFSISGFILIIKETEIGIDIFNIWLSTPTIIKFFLLWFQAFSSLYKIFTSNNNNSQKLNVYLLYNPYEKRELSNIVSKWFYCLVICKQNFYCFSFFSIVLWLPSEMQLLTFNFSGMDQEWIF